MRPLRLDLEGFGTFRHPATVDLSDAGHFALVGPTGAGKTTLIDAICFALYGSVPRWPARHQVSLALAPSTGRCRVSLIFQVGAERYAAVRVLTRNPAGRVGTREARLDALPADTPVHGPLAQVLAATAGSVATGDGVSAAVTELLGLTWEHFTRCVVLPQGRFADLLHATPGQRQDLLVALLGLDTYAAVGRRARELAAAQEARASFAREQAAELADATPAARRTAEARITTLADLDRDLRTATAELTRTTRLSTAARTRQADLDTLRDALDQLRRPAHLGELAAAMTDAAARRDDARHRATEAATALAGARTAAQQAGPVEYWQRLHSEHLHAGTLAHRIEQAATARDEALDKAETAAELVAAAETAHERARDALDGARLRHAAAELATTLVPGEPCPVCARPVTGPAAHAATPPDLHAAETTERTTAAAVTRARRIAAEAAATLARQDAATEAIRREHATLLAGLAALPATPADGLVAARAAAAAVRAATTADHAATAALAARTTELTALRARAGDEHDALARARDLVVRYGAPPLPGSPAAAADTLAAWDGLLAWAATRRATATAEHAAAARDEQAAAARHAELTAAMTALLEAAGIAPPAELTEAAVAATAGRAQATAAAALARLRARIAERTRLRRRAGVHARRAEVARELGRLLDAGHFEKWLCAEALDLLVADAGATLAELSAGQYDLARAADGSIEVIDHLDADSRRPVRTLSGGETFQASLALALALPRQVTTMSATVRRSLDTILLDEGFGSLDSSSLDTVATTLEQLAATGDRTVGIVTHVPQLAQRVPVRFEVSRDAAGSRVRRA